eukprot:335491_1
MAALHYLLTFIVYGNMAQSKSFFKFRTLVYCFLHLFEILQAIAYTNTRRIKMTWIIWWHLQSQVSVQPLHAGHPVDSVKVRMQTTSHNQQNIFRTIYTIIQQEGVMPFYRGVFPPAL